MKNSGLLATGAKLFNLTAIRMFAYAKIFFAYLALTVLIALCVTAGAGLSCGFGFVAFGVVTYANVFLALLALSVIFALFVTSGADLQYVV